MAEEKKTSFFKCLCPLDFVIFAFALFTAFFFTWKFFFPLKKNADFNKNSKVVVIQDKKRYEYSAYKNATYTVQGSLGKTVFQVKDKKIRILSSPCTGKNCVLQGWGSPLVCLPNNVMITLETSGDFDAVSR